MFQARALVIDDHHALPCFSLLSASWQLLYGPPDKINFAVKNTTKGLLHILL